MSECGVISNPYFPVFRVISGPCFPVFVLNTGICGVSRHIRSECGRMRAGGSSVFGALLMRCQGSMVRLLCGGHGDWGPLTGGGSGAAVASRVERLALDPPLVNHFL